MTAGQVQAAHHLHHPTALQGVAAPGNRRTGRNERAQTRAAEKVRAPGPAKAPSFSDRFAQSLVTTPEAPRLSPGDARVGASSSVTKAADGTKLIFLFLRHNSARQLKKPTAERDRGGRGQRGAGSNSRSAARPCRYDGTDTGRLLGILHCLHPPRPW